MDQENGKSSCGRKKCCSKLLFVIAVLLIARAIWLFGIAPIGYRIVGTPAAATASCPTSDNLAGTGGYQAGPEKTQGQALASAAALMQGRADIEAGLAMNKYTCPNPACQSKKLGKVVAAPDAGYPVASQLTFWSMAATIFDLFTATYWSADMKYAWQAKISCS